MLSKLIDVVKRFDDVALNEFFILFAHAGEVTLYFGCNFLKMLLYFLQLIVNFPILPLQFVDSLCKSIVSSNFNILEIFAVCLDC